MTDWRSMTARASRDYKVVAAAVAYSGGARGFWGSRGQPACFCSLDALGAPRAGGRVGGGSPRGRWSELPVCSALEPARAALALSRARVSKNSPSLFRERRQLFFVGVRRVGVVLRKTRSFRENSFASVLQAASLLSLIHRSVFLAGCEPDCTRIAARGVSH